MKRKPLTKFEQGYICAVSTLIGGHGCNTEAVDTFNALGRTLDDVLAHKGLCEYDIDNLSELKDWNVTRAPIGDKNDG